MALMNLRVSGADKLKAIERGLLYWQQEEAS
jgi:hypothetical protein